MGTIIELFDEEQLENVASHLLFPEEKVVFLGYKNIMTKKRKTAVSRFFQARGCAWTPDFIEVERFDLSSIVSAADAALARESGCRFDLTGGGELALVAMGVLSERHGLPMMQVNLRSGALTCVSGQNAEPVSPAPFTVSQLALLHGGCVVASDDETLPTTDTLRGYVSGLWALCGSDKALLNRTAAFLNTLAAYTAGLAVEAAVCVPPSVRTSLNRLYRGGYISGLYIGDSSLSFFYRDETVRRLLTKAGLTLEVLTRIAAVDTGVFSDVRQGVALDWDGVLGYPENPIETRNEADIILMRGMTPIFISCKNGDVKKEALYELDVVAERFGGAYAKKALVCSALTGSPAANAALRLRARDMGVTLIENVCEMTCEALTRELAKLR